MDSSKGMIYTTFAIMASSLIFFMAALSVTSNIGVGTSDALRIGEASFYLDSVLEDAERSTSIATRRGLTGSSNYIISEGEAFNNSEAGLASAIVNGSVNGVDLNSTGNGSLSEWSSKVENLSQEAGYQLDLKVSRYGLNSSGFSMDSSMQIEARLKDPVTLVSFNRTESVQISVSIEEVEDPLILLRSKGRYTPTVNRCGFDSPADSLGTGAQDSSPSVLGEAVVNPVDTGSVEDKAEKVLVVDSDAHLESGVDQFAGVVTYGGSDPVSTDYIFNTGDLGIGTGQDVILSGNEVWNSNFEEMIFENCYIPAEAPGLMERYENNLTEVEDGMLTLVDVASLPDALRYEGTAVGYKYFSQTQDGGLNSISGVTDSYSWFRLDDEDVNRWSLGSLTA